MVEEADILAEDGLIVVEEHQSVVLPAAVGSLTLTDHRRYGETGLWFFAPQPATRRP
jgi:16S rRNA (guanine966-N2)-methyltransferase